MSLKRAEVRKNGENRMVVSIRVNLEGKIAEDFKFLKGRRGLKNNSELIRLLITEAAQKLRGKPAA